MPAPVFENGVVTPSFETPGNSLETAQWSVPSVADRYLLAFAGSAGFFPQPVSGGQSAAHSGSAGDAMTALIASVIGTGGDTAARAYGLAAPSTGLDRTTYVSWGSDALAANQALIAAVYSNVQAVGDVQSNVSNQGGGPQSIGVSVSTPNTDDIVVAFAWAIGFSGASAPDIQPADTAVARGVAAAPSISYAARVIEKARTGSTTTITANVDGMDTATNMGIIAVVLQGATVAPPPPPVSYPLRSDLYM